MFGVCLGLPLDKIEYGKMCRIPILTWILVIAGFYFLGIIKNLSILCSLRKPYLKKVKKFVETIDVCCIVLPQIGWMIYGNTFIYSEAGLECKDLTPQSRSLWILMVILISFGYILFLITCCICLLIPLICIASIRQNQSLDQVVDRIPYAEALKSLNKTTFKNAEGKND